MVVKAIITWRLIHTAQSGATPIALPAGLLNTLVIVPHFSILLFAETVFGRFCEHRIQIAAPRGVRIATADNNRPGFFDFRLTHSGLAQATLLFGGAD
jgi:hypothetical protein